jgi:hypothetical protein
VALKVRGVTPKSVFGLNGYDENSASYALGWVLERSSHFRKAVVAAVFGETLEITGALIELQKHGADRGFSDVEIQSQGQFHVILEAKRGWAVTSEWQLRRYLPRVIAGGSARRRLVSVSAADPAEAKRRLPTALSGVPVTHLSWRDIQRHAERAHGRARSLEEKLWLRELAQHLKEYTAMDRTIDNKVFVVSLGTASMVKGKSHTWIDVVAKDKCYFHPIGHRWPVQPPTYVGFRYYGRLQSVHHIESFEIADDVAKVNPAWPKTDYAHFVYRLGPPMRPPSVVKTGKLYPSGRVWCAIDTLLSGAFGTISAARDETKRRLAQRL